SKMFETDEVRTHALQAIDLTIQRGDYLAVSGPSGCGKSTLLSILGLLDAPSTGEYWLGGRDVSSLGGKAPAVARNPQTGFIFQGFKRLGDLSVAENVPLPLTYRGISAAQRKERVDRALERVGMTHRASHYPSQLSGGQQQRVAVARAVAGDPAILLADEPTGNLDSKNGEAVMALLGELHAGGATLCIVTHHPRFADRADRVVPLLDGRVVEEAEALTDRPPVPQALGAARAHLS